MDEIEKHGNGICDFDTNLSVERVLWFSFLPTLIVRLYGFIKYPPSRSDPIDFRNTNDFINFIWHGSFGIWTLCMLY